MKPRRAFRTRNFQPRDSDALYADFSGIRTRTLGKSSVSASGLRMPTSSTCRTPEHVGLTSLSCRDGGGSADLFVDDEPQHLRRDAFDGE